MKRTYVFIALIIIVPTVLGTASDNTTRRAPVWSARAPAGQVIDFEDLSTGGPGGAGPAVSVFTQYASKGVIFNGPLALDYSKGFLAIPGFAHSGTKVIEQCVGVEFCTTPIIISLTAGQRRAKLWVGYSARLDERRSVILQALDQNGGFVGEASAVLGPSNGPISVQIPLEVVSQTPNIRQLILRFSVAFPGGQAFNNNLVIDDFEFDTVGPPPPCGTTQNPFVTLNQPQNGQTVQRNEFMLQGAVNTAALLDEATLTATASGGSQSVSLLSAGLVSRTGGPFGPTRITELLLPGSNTVSVSMRNCHGTGQNSRTVTFTPIADGTRFKLLGLEITQATQDLRTSVPLIAGKPTAVRAYLRVDGPTSQIRNVSGALTAFRSGESSFPNLQSLNTISVDSSEDINAKRLNIGASLNFELPPEWTTEGEIHIQLSHLDIEGSGSALPCDGCDNLNESDAPRFVQFLPLRRLNLVLAPYDYLPNPNPPFPLTADFVWTPMGALQWLNAVYPLSGNFPLDDAGIKVRILNSQTTTRNLQTSKGKDDFLGDLQSVLTDLQAQSGTPLPRDVHLFGMVPCGCGGQGYLPGQVAFGDTWAVENGSVPSANFEIYGSIWAQEIGHNFGLHHAGNSHGEPDPNLNFPYPHGGIGEPGLAVRTDWWNGSLPFLISPGVPVSGNPHAHDFMSYGAVSADSGEHTYSWVSPYTYEGLLGAFDARSQRIVRTYGVGKEKLIAIGQIDKDGTVTLRPFHRVMTDFVSGPGTVGEFSLELIDANSNVLLTYRFNAQTVPGEGKNSLGFAEFVPWQAGAKIILLKRKGVVLAKRTVTSHTPSVRVLSPKKEETWGAKATVAWEASDADGDPLSYTVQYNSGLDQIWWPIANDLTTSSITVNTALLPGSTKARVRVRATDGVNTAEAESDGTFTVVQKRPFVAILRPASSDALAPGAFNQLLGVAYDPEDGLLSSQSLKWTSNRDGLIGLGRNLNTSALSRGSHVLTLTATDSQGQTSTARVEILVGRERIGPR